MHHGIKGILGLLLFCASGARADTRYVSLSGTHEWPFTNWVTAATNIQSAIDAANGGETVIVGNGTFEPPLEITVGTNLLVESANGAAATFVDGRQTTRCFRLSSNANCILRGLTLSNGSSTNEGGGVWAGPSNAILDCVFINCTARYGGAVYANLSTVSNCTFIGNAAAISGGGLHCDGGTVINCTFDGNSAFIGGGMIETWNEAYPQVRDSTFKCNKASSGGGLCCGSLTNVSQVMTNVIPVLLAFTNVVRQLDYLEQSLTNMFSQLPQGLDGSPEKGGTLTVQSHVGANTMSGAESPPPGEIVGCVIVSNTADYGGGLLLVDTAEVVLTNCLFRKNQGQIGGGIFAADGGELCDTTLAENDSSALAGGLLLLDGRELRNCTIISNHTAVAGGGAVVVSSEAFVTTNIAVPLAESDVTAELPAIKQCEFRENSADTVGGGLILASAGTTEHCSITRNHATWGGGLALWGGAIHETDVTNNSASFGGGIFATEGSVSNCAVQGNRAEWLGGGVFALVPLHNLTIRDCLLGDNLALAGGGMSLLMASYGMGLEPTALVQACSITSNTASTAGGGILFLGGGDLQSSLVSRNTACEGGGILCAGGTIQNCTVADNSASGGGGGIYCLSNATVCNTILYTNAGANGANYANDGTNIIYSFTCTTPLVPGFGNIADDPGFVDAFGDFHLKPTSPCIDAGTTNRAPNRDLDGVPRPLDGNSDGVPAVDIGAYEFSPWEANTHYVSLSGHHQWPFTNWVDAATNIQDAIDAASHGGTVKLNSGTYSVWQELTITQGIALVSIHGPQATIVDGMHTTRCLRLSHPDARVEAVSFANGHFVAGADFTGGAGIYCTGGTLTNCSVRDNVVAVTGYIAMGGGICIPTGSIHNCSVVGNQIIGDGIGGGIAGSGLIENTLIESNAATWGGGLALARNWEIDWAALPNQNAQGQTAASDSVATGRAAGCTIRANQTTSGYALQSGAGGAFVWQGCTLQDSSILNNLGANWGGGVCCGGGATISNCWIAGNDASSGGGVACENGTIVDCQIDGNAAVDGGGVYTISPGVAILRNCTIAGNVALTNGGGMMCDSSIVIQGCEFLDNSAGLAGGGLCYGSNTVDVASLSNVVDALEAVSLNLTNMLSRLPEIPGGMRSLRATLQPGTFPISSQLPTVDLRGQFANISVDPGAGVAFLDTEGLLVSNCLFGANVAQIGGGIYMENGGMVGDTAFLRNSSAAVGGGAVVVNAGVLHSCSFASNSADIAGGGVMLAGAVSSGVITGIVPLAASATSTSEIRVQDSQFVGNSAGTTGGGLLLGGECVAASNTVTSNFAPWGGGIANWGGDVRDSTVAGNTASFGGGIFALGGSVSGCTLHHNVADWMGGGVIALSAPSSVAIGQCMFVGNTAFAGGGIAFSDSVQVEACRLTDNTAARAGGGVFCVYGGELRSSLVSGNVATDGGGAYYLDGGRLINSTLTGNNATNAGGLCVVTNAPGGPPYPKTTAILNTIIYGNTADNGVNFLNVGTNVSFSYCCTVPTPETGGEGNITNAPQLTPSGRLKSTSPCIDAGTALEAPPTDIDGEARWDHPGHSNVVSIVDIGADEFVDADLDNMADYWETEAFGSVTNRDGTADADTDALNDLAEYENSTTPTNSDTDADEMPDGWEVSHTLNPLSDDAQGDPDCDHMRNLGEYVSDTDPHDADSVLSLIRVDRQFGGIRLDWKGGREAWQILECRENLASTTEQWTAIFALPPPTATTNAVIDMGATNPALFYRIRAER